MKKYILLLVSIFFIGCANLNMFNDNLLENNKKAVNDLIKQKPDIINNTIIVTTITNANDLDNSSDLGRVITEQIITNLSKKGIQVVEVRMRKNDIIKVKPKNGEFILTRNALQLAKTKNADAVLVGTYSSYANKIYVTIRIIDPTTNIIIASSDYILNYSDL